MPESLQKALTLCPGQGAQSVGMGQGWFSQHPVAAQTFAAADKALGFSLSDLCFNGPAEQLNRTDMAQLAIYTSSVACYQALLEQNKLGPLTAVAGLSLGEFTALHLAGAYDFVEGLNLVKLRGRAMQDAAEASRGSMVALTGDVTEEKVQQLCDRVVSDLGGDEVLVPANYNSPMQVVVSGSMMACEKAVGVASEMGFKPTPLTVAGAFHSPLMQPAAERLADALDEVRWNAPTTTVISNVTGRPHEDVDTIKQKLVAQLTSPVRWTQSMQWAVRHYGESTRYVELAPGKVLSGLMKRIDRGTKVENFDLPG